MDAMKRLERAGFRFGMGDGMAIYHYEPGDAGPPMSRRPREVQEVVFESTPPTWPRCGPGRMRCGRWSWPAASGKSPTKSTGRGWQGGM